MRVYATPTQLATWTGSAAPGNAAALLRAASLLVDGELLTAVYPTTEDGLPRDEGVAEVLADAVCAQAATWAALGIDPATGVPADTGTATVKSKKIGTAAIDYDTTAATLTAQTKATAGRELSQEARQILASAGLLTHRVWTHG